MISGGKNLRNLNACFDFLAAALFLNISHPNNNPARYQHYCTQPFLYSAAAITVAVRF
jgi:hypothetical protein